MRVDVLILGGGASGLWCLDRFRAAGYHTILLEANKLGAGQTIQAQGIIHGGGKYALRGVRDFAAVRAIRSMPERWRRSLAGCSEPSLSGTRVLSEHCYLWLPRASVVAKAQSWGFLSLVASTGLLATRPVKVERREWPASLHESAAAVYAMDEQVISAGSLLQTLLTKNQRFVFSYDSMKMRFSAGRIETGGEATEARVMILTAGDGNAELMHRAGVRSEIMQRRPLNMVLLRGPLPPLFGHCVIGGKTQLTITTPAPGIWQVGGEIAEQLAKEEDAGVARRQARREIQRCIPELDWTRIEIALYRAVRAEGRTSDLRRPSGVHASYVAPGIVAAWPTKLALVPVLADEVLNLVSTVLKAPAGYDPGDLPQWPKPPVAPYPWEIAQWCSGA
jgi:glycine/D-amino acid oxidase-like deaminating enzyme